MAIWSSGLFYVGEEAYFSVSYLTGAAINFCVAFSGRSAAYHRWSWRPPRTDLGPHHGLNIGVDLLPGISPTAAIESPLWMLRAPMSGKVRPAPTRGSIVRCGVADISPDAAADCLDAEGSPPATGVMIFPSTVDSRPPTAGEKRLNLFSPSITVRIVECHCDGCS